MIVDINESQILILLFFIIIFYYLFINKNNDYLMGGAIKNPFNKTNKSSRQFFNKTGEKIKDGSVKVGEKIKDGSVKVGEKIKDGSVKAYSTVSKGVKGLFDDMQMYWYIIIGLVIFVILSGVGWKIYMIKKGGTQIG